MPCESEALEVQNAELSLDGAGQGLDQAIAVYSQAMERLVMALQALADCKAKFQLQPGIFQAQAAAAIQSMDSMRITVASNAQQCINMLLDAPCPVPDPEPEPEPELPAPTPIPEEEAP